MVTFEPIIDHRARLERIQFEANERRERALIDQRSPDNTPEMRVREVMREEKLSHREAEKIVRRNRASLPSSVNDGNIYLKLFKNIPRSDQRSSRAPREVNAVMQSVSPMAATITAVARGIPAGAISTFQR